MTNGQAELTVTGLQCGVMYTVTAEGRMSAAFEGFELFSNTTIPCVGKFYGCFCTS